MNVKPKDIPSNQKLNGCIQKTCGLWNLSQKYLWVFVDQILKFEVLEKIYSNNYDQWLVIDISLLSLHWHWSNNHFNHCQNEGTYIENKGAVLCTTEKKSAGAAIAFSPPTNLPPSVLPHKANKLMENGPKQPTFEEVPKYLLGLSNKLDQLFTLISNQATPADSEPYADFNWLCEIFSNVPASTLRQKSAAGKIPGTVRFGKRVLYEKAVVLNWLRSQTRTLSNSAIREQDAEAQFTAQHQRKGGRKDA